jgi:hypothetical protein
MRSHINPIKPTDKDGNPVNTVAKEPTEKQLNSAPTGAGKTAPEEVVEEVDTNPAENNDEIVTDDNPESSKSNSKKDTKKTRKPRKNQGSDIATD